MCRFASFLHNPARQELAVFNLLSHSETQQHLQLTESMGWYEGHYTCPCWHRRGSIIECRVPGGIDTVMDSFVKSKWPTFFSFLKWALKNGANIEGADENGKTPIMVAAEFGSCLACKILLKAGADKTKTSNSGKTIDVYCDRGRNPRVRKLILDA